MNLVPNIGKNQMFRFLFLLSVLTLNISIRLDMYAHFKQIHSFPVYVTRNKVCSTRLPFNDAPYTLAWKFMFLSDTGPYCILHHSDLKYVKHCLRCCNYMSSFFCFCFPMKILFLHFPDTRGIKNCYNANISVV